MFNNKNELNSLKNRYKDLYYDRKYHIEVIYRIERSMQSYRSLIDDFEKKENDESMAGLNV